MAKIIEQIKSDLDKAIKNRQERAVSALRFLLSALHNEEILRQRELADEEIFVVIRKQVKTHQESIEAFQKGGREDLVQKETEEKNILSALLPAQLSEEEIRKVVCEVISSGIKDFGQVMGQSMGKLKGQADGATVAQIVKEELEK